MKLKDNRGSILVTTIVIFMVLIVFASFSLSFMVSENKQAIHHQNRGQAYYIARGGAEAVEAAILAMDEEGIESLVNSLPLEYNDIEIGEHTADVRVVKEKDNLLISSVAEYNGVENRVEKVLEGEEVSQPLFDSVIYAYGNVTIGGSGSEKGGIEGKVIYKGSLDLDDKIIDKGNFIFDSNFEIPKFDFSDFENTKPTLIVAEDTNGANLNQNNIAGLNLIVYEGVGEIKLNNGTFKGLIYAPNATVSIQNDKVFGAIIAKNLVAQPNSFIKYQPENFPNILKQSNQTSIEYKPGYFK